MLGSFGFGSAETSAYTQTSPALLGPIAADMICWHLAWHPKYFQHEMLSAYPEEQRMNMYQKRHELALLELQFHLCFLSGRYMRLCMGRRILRKGNL